MEQSHIVILHIPKTGGTSLRRLVRNNYEEGACFYAYGADSGYTTQDDLKKLSQEEKNSYKVFMGHLPFIPRLFPALNTVYVTMMRDPVKRVLSYYHHVMKLNENWTSRRVSLLKYLEISNDKQLDNHQTRIISGMVGPLVSDEHLAIAKNNIDNHFAYVGLVEQYPQSIANIAGIFGWEKVDITRENVSVGAPNPNYYSDYEIQKIHDMNAYDYELYDYAKNKFFIPAAERDALIKEVN